MTPAALAPTISQSTITDARVVEPEPAGTDDEIGIVAAASLARLTTDNSFGGSAVFDRVNIVGRFGSPSPDGFLEFGADSSLIGPEVRAAVEQALVPMTVTWVNSPTDVIGAGPDFPTHEDVGPVLSIGMPEIDGDRAQITTGLWCGSECGTGGAYGLEWTESQGWSITGLEGPQWIA